MALKSMTGFGAGSASNNGFVVEVELSSVNRKQLDIHLSFPRRLSVLDARAQKRIRAAFSRGRISGSVRVEMTEEQGARVSLNRALAREYVQALRDEAAELNLPDNLGAESLLRLPDLWENDPFSEQLDALASVLDEALDRALDQLLRMRQEEGKALAEDLLERIAQLESRMEAIEQWAPQVVKLHRDKLLQRLEEAQLGDLSEDERVLKEVALFADRSDISEELVRLRSHLQQARTLLNSTEPAGRTLDFLCQELFREINTIGSKANALEITRQVVDFKADLERIREQVQNVE